MKKYRTIAVFRVLQLGDVLCAIPALRELRNAFPGSKIDLIGLPWAEKLVTRYERYLSGFIRFPGYPGLPEQPWNSSDINNFLSEMRRRNYDLVIQMHGRGNIVNELCQSFRAKDIAGFYPMEEPAPEAGCFIPYPEQGHEAERHLSLIEALGVPVRNRELEFPLFETDAMELQVALNGRKLTSYQYVCVHAGARYESRRWPVERLATVADHLSLLGYRIVLTGLAEERPLVSKLSAAMRRPSINLAGRTTLGAVALLVSRSALLLTNDTGLSHIADAVQAPSVVLGLGSDIQRWAPRDRNLHTVVSQKVDCQPCEYRTCPIHFPCAFHLSVDAVFEACFQMLRRMSHSLSRRHHSKGNSEIAAEVSMP